MLTHGIVSMTTAAWRTGGCVHVTGHCTHHMNKREKAQALSLLQNKNCVHNEGNDVMNQCVLARGAALRRSCFSRGNE